MYGRFGLDPLGYSPYGGGVLSFRVVGATALHPYAVVVQFNYPIDVTYAPYLDTANYTIPGLTVSGVVFESQVAVRLFTSEQLYDVYTVTVGQAQALNGVHLDVLFKEAQFTGVSGGPKFYAVALTPNRVRLVFSEAMRQDANLTDPTNYTLKGIQGGVIGIDTVTEEQSTNVLSLVLTTTAPLHTTDWYAVRVSSDVKTISGLSIEPNTQVFQWIQAPLRAEIGLDKFTGEVRGGLFGTPEGLVFFSPALDVPAANSVIQIDEVDVCTRAFDVYTPPEIPDPPVLFTYRAGVSPPVIGGGCVLWAPLPRLSEARLDLALKPSDVVRHAEDGPAAFTFREPWDHAYVSLLNNPAWSLYDGTLRTGPAYTFKTASNLAPIPPGPNTTIVVESATTAAMSADSQVTGSLQVA